MLFPNVALAFTEVFEDTTFRHSQEGFSYKEASFSHDGKQRLYYGEYNPTQQNSRYQWVIHSVRENYTTTRTTVLDIAKDYEATTGKKVVFAANGDYFDLNSGANMESYVNDGVVISKGSFDTKHCIGFDNNGKVAVGRLTETQQRILAYDDEGQRHFFEIDVFNKPPQEGQIAVYNQVGNYTLENVGVIVAKTESANLTMFPVWGQNYNMTAAGVQNTKTFSLKSGQFAVVYTKTHNEFFANHSFGNQLSLVELPDGQFSDCDWVLGGYDILVDNFVANTKCHTDNDGNGLAPRTFVGFKEDGTCFVCVVDGRQLASVGITVNDEAQLAKQLGAKFALELDGGGSSTIILRLNDNLTLRNSPSDGTMRRVSNAILLVEKSVQQQPGESDQPSTDHEQPDVPVTPDNPQNPNSPNNSSEQPPFITNDLLVALVVCVAVVAASVVTVFVLICKRSKGGK